MAVGVASQAVGHAAGADGAGDDAGQGPSGVAVDEEPIPAEGVRELEVEGKGAGPSEGAPVAIAVEGGKEEEEEEEEADTAAAAAKAEDEEGDAGDDEEGEKLLGCYSSTQSILLVGDGDFSFSLALATAFRSGTNIVATSLDTYEVLLGKYSEAESNITKLKSLETTVLHGVDVKTMKFHTDLKNKRFDRIVFNFPHAGFRGREDQVHMINSHKRLLRDFFCNALYLLIPYGEIHVRHKTEGPYDRWGLEQLASDSSLIIFEKEKFQKADYPGYNQKRGDGARCDQPFHLGPSCTFKFQIGDLKKRKKSSGNNATSISFIGGSNVRPSGKLETDTRLLYLLPPVQARPWLYFTLPANTVRMPIPPQPYIAQRQQPLSLDDIVRALSHPQPMFSIAGPSLNAWCAPGSISSPMGRTACPNLLAPQEQLWHQQRSIAGQPGGDVCSYFEHQRCLQRDYEVRRKAMMPGAAGLMYSSAFLDQCHREHVQRQWLRECEMQREMPMPGVAGLKYSSAFLEQCRRDVLRQERLNKR